MTMVYRARNNIVPTNIAIDVVGQAPLEGAGPFHVSMEYWTSSPTVGSPGGYSMLMTWTDADGKTQQIVGTPISLAVSSDAGARFLISSQLLTRLSTSSPWSFEQQVAAALGTELVSYRITIETYDATEVDGWDPDASAFGGL